MEDGELQALVRDRHQRTPEVHPPSDFYGHAAALKRYAGLPAERPLAAVVEHGPPPAPYVWELDARAPFPTFLCAGEQQAELYKRRRHGGTAVPIGPMIHYAAPGPPPPRPRGRLLVFPAHSTHYVKSVYDAPAFARTLAGYRDRFSEITVCLYWKDALHGAAVPYRAEGFDVVSAGHMFDLGFLSRLRALLDGADVVASNQYGSYVPYAVALGRPVWLLQQDVELVGREKDLARDTLGRDVFEDATREIRRRFSEESDEVTDEQRTVLDPFCGFGHVRAPEEVRALLDDARERYLRATTPPQRAWHWLVGRVARPVVARLR